MCGITAMSRNPKGSSIPDGRAVMREALKAIESRGEHATGAAWYDPKERHPYYWKTEGPARRVVEMAPFPVGMMTAIGHTRYATQGSPKKKENNHPVTAPGIVLVHNGRVDNDDAIFAVTKQERQGEVDSEAIAALLSSQETFGGEHPAELLELVEGVAAVAWLAVEEANVLHLARLAVRPMQIGWTRKGDLLMSSTNLTLAQTAHRARVVLVATESVPEGCYLRVEGGKVTDRRRFRIHVPQRAVAADIPQRKSRTTDGIDWDNLAPRRGWR